MISKTASHSGDCALENPAAPRPRLRPMKGARGPWRYTLGTPRLLKLEEVCTVQCADGLAESTGQARKSQHQRAKKEKAPSADPSWRERPQFEDPGVLKHLRRPIENRRVGATMFPKSRQRVLNLVGCSLVTVEHGHVPIRRSGTELGCSTI